MKEATSNLAIINLKALDRTLHFCINTPIQRRRHKCKSMGLLIFGLIKNTNAFI